MLAGFVLHGAQGMKRTNKLNLPEAIVRAVANDPYDKGDCEFTLTELLKPPRARALEKQHADELEEDVSDVIYRLFGKLGHLLIQQAGEGANSDIIERRFFAELGGVKISGAADLVRNDFGWPERGMGWDIWDWKYTSMWTTTEGAKPEWVAQLNGLKWLAGKNNYKIGNLFVAPIYRDWSKSKSLYTSGYPRQQLEVFPVEVWPAAKTEAYFGERIRLHQAALKELPECTAAERWAAPDTWKCKKKPGGRAVRGGVFTRSEAALEFATKNKLIIEKTTGTSKRCQSYCGASPFCQQWQAEKKPNPITEEEEAFVEELQ